MTQSAGSLSKFSPDEIKSLFKRAKRVVKHPAIHLLTAPSSEKTSRILVITSRKVGPAVKRNKLRRQIKAIFYENKLYEKGLDVIAILKPDGTQLTFDELKQLLLQLYENKQTQ